MPQKPITLLRRDFINNICNAVNNSGLPAFVVADVLDRLLSDTRAAVETELKRDEIAYRQALMNEKKETQDGRETDSQ